VVHEEAATSENGPVALAEATKSLKFMLAIERVTESRLTSISCPKSTNSQDGLPTVGRVVWHPSSDQKVVGGVESVPVELSMAPPATALYPA
jgi:hypothetical protein